MAKKAIKKRTTKPASKPVKKKPVKKPAAKKRVSKKNPAKAKRKNGDAAAAERYKFFHGKDPDVVFDIDTPKKYHSTLSGIGKLEALFILSPDGYRVKIGRGGGCLLAQDPKGKQLFIEGGNQKVNLADFGIKHPHEIEVLGLLDEVWYDTEKTHLRPEDGGKAVYQHRFKGNGKNAVVKQFKFLRKPTVIYDVRNELLSLAGGDYDLPEVGIRG